MHINEYSFILCLCYHLTDLTRHEKASEGMEVLAENQDIFEQTSVCLVIRLCPSQAQTRFEKLYPGSPAPMYLEYTIANTNC